MIDSEQFKQHMVKAVEEIRATNPMAGSITNTVTIDFVANAQLAVGGSAAMVYLPDEGEALVAGGGAIYLNMGTLFPIYEQTIPRAAKAAQKDTDARWTLKIGGKVRYKDGKPLPMIALPVFGYSGK